MQKKSKAEIIRKTLDKNIKKSKRTEGKIHPSVQTMLDIAELGKKHNVRGPKDLSENMDKYLWDEHEV